MGAVYVRIDRDDSSDDRSLHGTRTYKGPYANEAKAQPEHDAWVEAFPTYDVQMVPVDQARNDMAAWSRAVRGGGRYPRPQEDPYPVGTHVAVRDYDGTVIPRAFEVARTYWPTPCVELSDPTDRARGLIRQNHDRIHAVLTRGAA